MTDSRCVSCQHYHTIDDEYAWCHECTMNNDHYKPMDELKKQEATDTNTGKWISVKDIAPSHHKPVLVYSMVDGGVTACYTTSGRWLAFDGCYVHKVTHWMPLPEPPKEVSGDA